MTANSSVATYDINIDQGGTFSLTISMLDSSNNNVLTGATLAEAQLREQAQSTTKIADFECDFAANNASLTCLLSANTTATLNKRAMHWDCKVTWPDRIEYILRGKALLNFTVTRS